LKLLGRLEQVMRHCLVVDDSEVIRKVARRILESLDFEVSEAENGQEAVERCIQHAPDVVLLDWQMPVMNGLEFLGALRLAAKGARPRIFYCLTENDPAEISRAFVGGADDYILKPYDRGSLSAKLSTAGLV
jgi:two-component system chemotaxis response regulator CheY